MHLEFLWTIQPKIYHKILRLQLYSPQNIKWTHKKSIPFDEIQQHLFMIMDICFAVNEITIGIIHIGSFKLYETENLYEKKRKSIKMERN